MHERVLRKIIGKRLITRHLAQEISYLRLVPPYQFAESLRVLAGDDACNE